MKTVEIEITDEQFEKLSLAAKQEERPIEETASAAFSFGLINSHQDLYPEIFEVDDDEKSPVSGGDNA